MPFIEMDAGPKEFLTALWRRTQSGEILQSMLCFTTFKKRRLIDFTGGREDLRKRLIRSVGKPEKRFKEDHLRILRALRFAHQLDFQIEAETKKMIPLFSQKIQKLSKERVLEELGKMFSSGRMGLILQSLWDHGLFPYIFPELESPFKAKVLKKPFVFWNQEFSFYEDQAFYWLVFSLPFFYSHIKSFHLFLKSLGLPSASAKKSLSYLKAVDCLIDPQKLFDRKAEGFRWAEGGGV